MRILGRRTSNVLIALFLVLSIVPVPSLAADVVIRVTTTSDDAIPGNGSCSLREAIRAANTRQAVDGCPAGSSSTVIELAAGVFNLSIVGAGEDQAASGDLDIASEITISGAGAGQTIIDASALGDRAFHVHSSKLSLVDLTVQNGTSTGDGGAILNHAALELQRVQVSDSTAGNLGGGIASTGGTMTIVDSLVRGNTGTKGGGGVATIGATATIERTTITGNLAGPGQTRENLNGGGIFNTGGGTISLVNSTISGNDASSDGGGIYNNSDSAAGQRNSVLLSNVTVFGNSASRRAGGLDNFGMVRLQNTAIAGNSAGSGSPDCRNPPGHQVEAAGRNLIQSLAGCSTSGNPGGVISGVDALLSDLGQYGGVTPTHLPLAGSPLIDAGDNAGCPDVDQRGMPRPDAESGRCDIGAVEAGPIHVTVLTTDDSGPGSLRHAIEMTNQNPGHDRILFNISGSPTPEIGVLSALPEVTDPVTIDGASQPGGMVTLKGDAAGAGVNGLSLQAGNTIVQGLAISSFDGDGILITSSGNLISGSLITLNGGAGVRVLSGFGNTFTANQIADNGGLGIDLGEDGPDANDVGDTDSGANAGQNAPVIVRVVPEAGGTLIQGRINSAPNTGFKLEFFSSPACDPSGFGEGFSLVGQTVIETGPNAASTAGNATFAVLVPSSAGLTPGQIVTATATGPDGSTSEFSQCAIVAEGNDSWVTAAQIQANGLATQGFIASSGQSRWYKFKVQPNSKVVVTLTNLPANYDLTLYKDIAQAYQSLTSNHDLLRLGAEFAPDAFSPDAFSPDAFSPDAFSPDAFSPDAFSPDAFSPDAFSPDAFSPDAFSPDAFSPDAFSPDAFSPDAFSPDAFSPDAFSPDAFSPDTFSPDAFSGAQLRSVIGVSAFGGTTSEGIIANTWDNDGDFYVRVRGSNGVFDLSAPFRLEVLEFSGVCTTVSPESLPPSSLTARAGGYQTIILTDLARMQSTAPGNDAANMDLMLTKLEAFANRADVRGVIVDVGADARVAAANSQADAHPACPYATNLVAHAVKDIVDDYSSVNPLEYVVIVGNDDTVPFFRHPDTAMLANEKNYVPPVLDRTSSQASLQLGYVLSQDNYGSGLAISYKSGALPIPQLAVGRLVETAAEINVMLDAYLSTASGVVVPGSGLVTGYDFLEDAALAVKAELDAGLGTPTESLIAPRDASPLDPRSWTAEQLRSALLGDRHDLVFLAGHFSANSALAADYRTRLLAEEIRDSPLDLSNVVIFSAGCHSGYNIVDSHGVPGVTLEPDWAQAFASKGVNLIAGTGYQYGDTDFIEYGERLYLEFSKQLRAGTGPVPIGKALVGAKQEYLAGTPAMRGIHQKTYLIATLFGFPMLQVDLPAGRGAPTTPPPAVGTTAQFTGNPGAQLGLTYADLSVSPALSVRKIMLTDVDLGTESPGTFEATYYVGSDGVVTNPAEPVLPLEKLNVSVPNTVLRGVGFRGGSYLDITDILPLTGATATEVRGVHPPFLSSVFYPVVPWTINYMDALANSGAPTWLYLTPAQYTSSSAASLTGTLRIFDELDLRLYYSDNTQTYPTSGNTPALAAPPDISNVSAVAVQDETTGNWSIQFTVAVHGDPSAGVQEVWITYTLPPASGGVGVWRSLDLTRTADSTRWTGTLPMGPVSPADLRFMVQAANGVGLVSLATNQGDFYQVQSQVDDPAPTSLTFLTAPSSGPYGTTASFAVLLSDGSQGLPNQTVFFGAGSQRRPATTGPDGRATIDLPLLGTPGETIVRASFGGDVEFAPSHADTPFIIVKQTTQVAFDPEPPVPVTAQYSDDPAIRAVVTDSTGRPLGQRTVIVTIEGEGLRSDRAVITDFAGRASLSALEVPAGSYQVGVRFGGTIELPTGTVVLEDERYHPSASSRPLLVEPETATLTLIGGTVLSVGSPLSITAIVEQDDDGTPGDITRAQVQFTLTGPPGTAPIVTTVPVAVDGRATLDVPDLTAGVFDLDATVVGGYFASEAVSTIVSVFDGSGGHVTGGGWMESPAGAYAADPALTGRANFGFVAKLGNGSSQAPNGQVQFQFTDGNINFKSVAVTSLTVRGSEAVFQGTGTVNGGGNYTFVVTAIDGGTNKSDIFRITIQTSSGNLVYRTCAPGSPPDCGTIDGGSIVIRRP